MKQRGGAERVTRVLALVVATAALACGGGQTRANVFSTEWDDDGGRSAQALYARLAETKIPEGANVVVAVTGNGDRIVGQPLGGARWTFAHPLDSRPMVTGRVVIGSGGGEIFALDATTGTKLWGRPTGGLPLLGAGDDGRLTVVTRSACRAQARRCSPSRAMGAWRGSSRPTKSSASPPSSLASPSSPGRAST